MSKRTPSHSVECSGSDSISKHPRVYLALDSQDKAQCPYCSIQYQVNNGTVTAIFQQTKPSNRPLSKSAH